MVFGIRGDSCRVATECRSSAFSVSVTLSVAMSRSNGSSALTQSSVPAVEPRFTVPKPQAELLAYLAGLDSSRSADLLTKLTSLTPRVFPVGALKQLVADFTDSSHSAEQIARAIQALHYTRQSFATISDVEFVDEAARAVLANDGVAPDESRLRALLGQLLSLRAVAVSTKSSRVVLDNERHMHDVTLYSDLRPVFDLGGTAIDGYVLIHTLKISYSEQDEDRDLYFYVDEADLAALEETVSRARRKAAVIRSDLGNARMTIIGDGS